LKFHTPVLTVHALVMTIHILRSRLSLCSRPPCCLGSASSQFLSLLKTGCFCLASVVGPSYTNINNVCAFCNVICVDWGTRPEELDGGGLVYKEGG
jgi:hypothetical protein